MNEFRSSRIILLTHEFFPFCGGVATYCEEMAGALHRRGCDVEVWAPSCNHCDLRTIWPYRVVRMNAGGSLRWGDLFRWGWEIWKRRGDLANASIVLCSVGMQMVFMILHACGCFRSLRIYALMYGSEIRRFEKYPLWKGLARRFFPSVQGIVGASHFAKALAQQSFLASAASGMIVAPCACSSAAVRPISEERIPHGEKIRLLTLARIHTRKGQLDAARALSRLKPEIRRKIVYQVAGSGDAVYLKRVRKVCEKSQVAFEYLGEIPRDRLAATYQQCDLYVMTSRTEKISVEGFGITYLEASFHGKPVVAYRTGGVAEAVLEDKTGLLVEEGDMEGLSRALEKLIEDPEWRRRLGKQGACHARSFQWDASAEIFAKLCWV